MDLQETMRELESLGSEQTRKTFLRHGAPEPLFGVKFGDLEKLRKRIKTNAGLAEALWDTGNSDARMLATMVADAAAMSWMQLDAWARALDWHSLVDVFINNVVVHSPHVRKALETWSEASGEMQRRAGWQLLAALAAKTAQLTDEELSPWLPRIEQGIHSAQNRVREAMNSALIAIGGRGGALQEAALEVARRVGKVEVDHGDTACETPDAAAYIEKVRAHREGAGGRAVTLAKNAVDSVRDMAAKAAAGAQSVASGAKSAVASAKNVMSGARDAMTTAQNAVSDVARQAAESARSVATRATKKAPANVMRSGAAKKASPASGARKAAAKKTPPRAAKKAPGKRAAPPVKKAATKKVAAKKAAPASKKAVPAAKKAAPAAKKTAAKKVTAKRTAPAAKKVTAKRAAPAAKRRARPRA
ncbi:DNA alkylation repair protein [Pyxidicoccus xibeiensis]|uniref:DNA alkylation repair protein n=1 Tax=Pyxidicoccus xibeiensis TaxID=2906759 RepID=UPI0020A7E663|nr:DNA alkylation repair protein [Pyxidicoccus xibeiensis]MCP3139201.1 DNA alkylation repair protein [Pyxidicoccus xibeiensis]